jgi:hypothetical protein
MRRIRLALLAAVLLSIPIVAAWTRLAPPAATAAPVPSLTPVPSASPVTSASPDPEGTPGASPTPVATASPVAGTTPPSERFAAPQGLTTAGSASSGPPGVAVDGKGRSLVAWLGDVGKHGGRIVARRGDSHGRFTAPRTLSPQGAFQPTATLAPDGTAAVIWQRDLAHGRRHLELAVARRGHGFGHVQTLVSVQANLLTWKIVAAGGRLVAVWWQGVPGHGHQVRYAIAGADGRFGTARTIGATGIFGGASATADAAGDVIVTWTTGADGQTNAQTAAAALPAGATRFGAPQLVSADTAQTFQGSEAILAQLFSGPGGVAAGYGVEGVLPWRMQVATAGPGGALGAPQTVGLVDNSSPGGGAYGGPAVALPAAGGAVAVWSQTQDASGENPAVVAGSVQAAGQRPDGMFAAPAQVSTASEVPEGNVGAVAAGATSIALWGDHYLTHQTLRYATNLAGVGFTAPATLAKGVDRGFATAASGDHAIAGWAAGHRVYVARFTAGAAQAG